MPTGQPDLYNSSVETSLKWLQAVSSWPSRLSRTLNLWLCMKTSICVCLAPDENVHRYWPNPPTQERKRIHILEWAACGEEWPLFLSLLCNLEQVISSQLIGSAWEQQRFLLTWMFSGSNMNQNPKKLKCQWAILSTHRSPLIPLSRCGPIPVLSVPFSSLLPHKPCPTSSSCHTETPPGSHQSQTSIWRLLALRHNNLSTSIPSLLKTVPHFPLL